MRKPELRLAIAINRRVHRRDEWFDEPDELDRVETALESIDGLADPVEAAGVLAFRVTLAQGFTEGNKRTALLLAKWTPDNNGQFASLPRPLLGPQGEGRPRRIDPGRHPAS